MGTPSRRAAHALSGPGCAWGSVSRRLTCGEEDELGQHSSIWMFTDVLEIYLTLFLQVQRTFQMLQTPRVPQKRALETPRGGCTQLFLKFMAASPCSGSLRTFPGTSVSLAAAGSVRTLAVPYRGRTPGHLARAHRSSPYVPRQALFVSFAN